MEGELARLHRESLEKGIFAETGTAAKAPILKIPAFEIDISPLIERAIMAHMDSLMRDVVRMDGRQAVKDAVQELVRSVDFKPAVLKGIPERLDAVLPCMDFGGCNIQEFIEKLIRETVEKHVEKAMKNPCRTPAGQKVLESV